MYTFYCLKKKINIEREQTQVSDPYLCMCLPVIIPHDEYSSLQV